MNWRIPGLCAAMLIAACAFAVFFVTAEDTIYFWDFGGYFNSFKEYGARFAAGDFGWLRSALYSLRHDDYNPSSLTPLLPLYALFGEGRAVYIAGVVGFYLVPACILAAMLSELARNDRLVPLDRLPAWVLVAAMLYWPFWSVTLRGFPDIAGLLPLGAATIVLLRPDWIRPRPLLYGALIGVLIWSAFALRRWYAYSCLSLLGVSGVIALWRLYADKASRTADLPRAMQFFGACGAVMLVLLLMQWPLVSRILTTSYSMAYAAYQSPFAEHFAFIYAQAGPLLILVIGAGLVQAYRARQWRTLILFACAAVSFLLFSRTQAPGPQHMLPWFFWLFPAFITGAAWLADLLRAPRAVWAAPALMALTCAAIYAPSVRASLALIHPFLPSAQTFPLRLENMDAYRALAADLRAEVSGDAKISVFGASQELADDMVTALEPSLTAHVEQVGDVDERDGLRKPAFLAAYALVSDPPALHLRPDAQQIIAEPNALILAGEGFGAGYERIAGPYLLARGVKAYLYRRTRPLSEEDWLALKQRFAALYPHWRDTENGFGPAP